MYNENKKGEQEYKDCKEDKLNNHIAPDLFRKCIHDVRNMKLLDKKMISNIRNMSDEKKMEIIIALNDVVEHINMLL